MPLLTDLQVLTEAVRCGSLSAAARVLGRTPAAASASLKRLETELGTRLLERNTRKLRLTPEGARYHDCISAGLAMIQEASHSLHPTDGELSGDIRLTAPVDLARQWLSEQLDQFQARHPAVRIILQLEDSAQDLLAEPLDLAIRYGQLPDSALVARRLKDNHRVLVASPEYLKNRAPLTSPDDLIHHNCLTYFYQGSPYRRWRFSRAGQTQVVEVSGDRSSNDGSVVREWALAGHGLAYKSRMDVQHDLDEGRLVPALPGWRGDDLPLQAVYPGGGPRPQRVRALVEHLQQALAS